jgi:uncharacterized protein YbjT (DUF2867 family)
MPRASNARLIGKGTTRRNFIAVRDIARFVELALDEPSLRNRMLELGGTDNLTDDEIAALYGRIAGVTPKVSRVPPGVASASSHVGQDPTPRTRSFCGGP